MNETSGTPRVPLARVFARFFAFGLRAWGGPVAQIPALREEFTGESESGGGWATPERFDRALAVYQALPGPEAHEMCMWLGVQARGRLGGLAAGLGFMLPGLVLVLLGAWAYVGIGGVAGTAWGGVLAGMQCAVAALIVRAVHRLGANVLKGGWLWAIALAAAWAQLAMVAFWVSLAIGAGVGATARGSTRWIAVLLLATLVAVPTWLVVGRDYGRAAGGPDAAATVPHGSVGAGTLFVSGLRGGALTFGGAYTLIPILREDAVERRSWVSDAEFLDAIAVTGVLPAPMVMFGTFVGFLAGGWVGALAMTAGLFLPAFAITLIAHGALERVVERRGLHEALMGVTAAVVGVMAASGAVLVGVAVKSWPAALVFGAALVLLYGWKSRWATPAAIGVGAVMGILVLR